MLTKKQSWEIEHDCNNIKDYNYDQEWYPADEVNKQFELLLDWQQKHRYVSVDETIFMIEKAQRGELK